MVDLNVFTNAFVVAFAVFMTSGVLFLLVFGVIEIIRSVIVWASHKVRVKNFTNGKPHILRSHTLIRGSLLPCPCCKANADVSYLPKRKGFGVHKDRGYIFCTLCGLRTPDMELLYAREHWNTRPRNWDEDYSGNLEVDFHR